MSSITSSIVELVGGRGRYVARLEVPQDEQGARLAAFVIAGPKSAKSVRAVADEAKRLAAAGYVTLTFTMDERDIGSVDRREGVAAAIDYLAAHPAVEPSLIFVAQIHERSDSALDAPARQHPPAHLDATTW